LPQTIINVATCFGNSQLLLYFGPQFFIADLQNNINRSTCIVHHYTLVMHDPVFVVQDSITAVTIQQ